MKNHKTPADKKDLQLMTGIKDTTFYKTLNSLISKNIIVQCKNDKQFLFFVNPWLIVKGDRINKVLKVMFENYYIRTLKKQWKDISDFDISQYVVNLNNISHKCKQLK